MTASPTSERHLREAPRTPKVLVEAGFKASLGVGRAMAGR
jgi:hypothetical protein